MKLFINFIIVLFLLFFTACSSKQEVKINENINSISLEKDVAIGNVPKTVRSPISIGIGLGGYISRHVGIHVGTSVRPIVSNSDALRLEQALNLKNVSLENVVANEFDNQMKNDSFYKTKYVPFGSNYKIHLYVPKYYLDTATFSSKAIVKIVINAKIYNENYELIYEDSQENDSSSSYYVFTEDEILNSQDALTRALQTSVRNCVAKIIFDMKKH